MANKAIKYRIYPTTEQAVLFAKTFGCCRKVWNLMLSDKIKSYEETKTFGKQTPAMYKREYPYLKEVDSLALANVQLHLQQAMKNCFGSKHCKFPKFKSAKHSRKSYTTNNQKGTITVSEKAIKLPKVGIVKAVIHCRADSDWKVKSATIVRDLEGNIGTNHKYYRESQEKLAKAQRILSRRKGAKKGEEKSNNYRKQQRKVGKIHRHIANQRLDHLHKLSTEITNQYDVICVESVHMRAMSNKGFGNGKATFDNGYGKFLELLEYKLKDCGKYLVKVSKWYPSSQICSCCGRRKKLSLEERMYECECGLEMDRDYNAAINIKREGLRILREEAV